MPFDRDFQRQIANPGNGNALVQDRFAAPLAEPQMRLGEGLRLFNQPLHCLGCQKLVVSPAQLDEIRCQQQPVVIGIRALVGYRHDLFQRIERNRCQVGNDPIARLAGREILMRCNVVRLRCEPVLVLALRPPLCQQTPIPSGLANDVGVNLLSAENAQNFGDRICVSPMAGSQFGENTDGSFVRLF